MKLLSIVVPVYFNEQSLPPLFERLAQIEALLLQMEVGLELIFVDDGSGDGSLAKLLELKKSRPDTRVIKLTRNFGANQASRCGFKFVTGDCFVLLAADLQDPPELIPEMARRWLEGARFVICERTARDDPLLTRMQSRIYYALVHLMVMPQYPAGGYDLALMDKRFLPHMQDASKSAPTLLLAYWLGFKPEVISYRREKRQHGRSRWTFRKKVRAFGDVLLGFSDKPLRWMSLAGLAVAGVSFLYGSVVVAFALLGNREVPGFATVASLIAFLLGVVIVMLGIIGEYLARILGELNRRPEVVIDDVY